MIRVGFIGAGFVSGIHRRVLAGDDRVEVTAVHDADPARRGPLGAASVDDLLERCDAVYITCPNTLHREMALRAIEAGKHVFCEKPMATTVEDARAIANAAAAASTVFQVGHNRRFAKVYKRLKEMLAERPPHTAHIKMNRGELLQPAWTGDDTITGGFLFETPIHLFDMVRFQFGEVVSVEARESRKNDFSILFELAGGMFATFVTSADASWFFPFERMEVFGEYSTIETAEMESIQYRLSPYEPTQMEHFSGLSLDEKWGFVEGDRRFIDAVTSGGEAPVTAMDGLRSVELCQAIYQSARERRRVEFPEVKA